MEKTNDELLHVLIYLFVINLHPSNSMVWLVKTKKQKQLLLQIRSSTSGDDLDFIVVSNISASCI